MSIEDYWNDVTIFYVTFTVENTEKKINKVLVLSTLCTNEDVKKIVKARFSQVAEVTRVDYWEEALLEKTIN